MRPPQLTYPNNSHIVRGLILHAAGVLWSPHVPLTLQSPADVIVSGSKEGIFAEKYCSNAVPELYVWAIDRSKRAFRAFPVKVNDGSLLFRIGFGAITGEYNVHITLSNQTRRATGSSGTLNGLSPADHTWTVHWKPSARPAPVCTKLDANVGTWVSCDAHGPRCTRDGWAFRP